MFVCVMLVCFVNAFCLVINYTMLMASMVRLIYWHILFVYFNHCFASCTLFFHLLLFLILCSYCFFHEKAMCSLGRRHVENFIIIILIIIVYLLITLLK